MHLTTRREGNFPPEKIRSDQIINIIIKDKAKARYLVCISEQPLRYKVLLRYLGA